MLQVDPKLTATEARQIIHNTAVSDKFTGATPNQLWGLGKINILGALNAAAALLNTVPSLNMTALNFGTQKIKTESAPQNIVFSNGGTDPLGIGGVSLTGTSYLITKNTCGSTVAPGGNCTISVAFKPKKTGTQTGSVTIKAFNPGGPYTVSLTGVGD